MREQQAADPTYVLGHEGAELARLARQASILNDITQPLLQATGIGPGMRVLDVGCGAGDVTFLAAGLVGAEGAVTGVDRSVEALAGARERAARLGILNVDFVQADLSDEALVLPEASFDAVVGRAVLYVLKDPVRSLKTLSRLVRSGGLVIFQEFDFTLAGLAWPRSPLWETIAGWWRGLQERAGLHPQMGLQLHSAFVEAGMPAPHLDNRVVAGSGPDSPLYEWIASTCRSILPGLDAFGVASPDTVLIDTLEERLRDEIVAGGGALISPPLVGAWSERPRS